MRYVFIVNPAAGKKDPYHSFFPYINNYLKSQHISYTVHKTEHPMHAAELAAAEAGRGDPVRIFGLGGDGTLSEIAAGAAGKKNAEVGIFPCGSGNDYIKTFGNEADFLSPEKQLSASSKTVDLIRSGDKISINLCTVGMDAKIPIEVAKMKRFPLLSGPAAYDIGLVKVLLGKLGDELQITIDGTKIFKDSFLMAVAGCGRYYGGGYCAAPEALPDDGLLDFILIRKPALHRIPKLVSLYKAGKHLAAKEFTGLLTFCRGKKMEIEAQHPIAENLDGECKFVNHASFEILPKSLNFIVPAADNA